MLGTRSITLPLLAAAFCWAGLASASAAQGGWRQWEVRLRDGTRLEANPLGAPDDGHLSLSVGAYDRRAGRISRALVRLVAARPLPGESLPEAPTAASCEDAIVLRDGTTTVGRISLTRVRWSEGVVVQRGNTVDLRDVAYLAFAAPDPENARCRHDATGHPSDVVPPGLASSGFAQPGIEHAVGRWQGLRPCADDCWAERFERMLVTSSYTVVAWGGPAEQSKPLRPR
jgi:hypothetical protein